MRVGLPPDRADQITFQCVVICTDDVFGYRWHAGEQKTREKTQKKKSMNERRKKGGKSVEGPRRDTKDSLLRTTDVS